MSSNTAERVATAKIELDKAEEWILNNPDEFQKELSEFMKQLSEWAKDFADIAKDFEMFNNSLYVTDDQSALKRLLDGYNSELKKGTVNLSLNDYLNKREYNKVYKDKLKRNAGVAGIASAFENFVSDVASGEGWIKSTVVNGGLLLLTTVVKRANPVFLIIDAANFIDSHTAQTGVFDLNAHIKKLYDKLTGSNPPQNNSVTDDGRKIEITSNGYLKVTMPDGTVYARPFYPNASGSISGGSKDDVIFGSNGNDEITGSNGADILIGHKGYNTYDANDGDVIQDDDGKGLIKNLPRKATKEKNDEHFMISGGGHYEIISGGIKYVSKDGKEIIINSPNIAKDSILPDGKSKLVYETLGIKLIQKDDDDDELPEDFASPLVLDLNNNSVTQLNFYENDTYFDLDNNGFKEKTAWIEKDDGFLQAMAQDEVLKTNLNLLVA